MIDYLACGEAAVKTLAACHAEFAPHAAAGLRRHAKRGTVAVGDENGFDVVAAHAFEEVFLRAVGGNGFDFRRHKPDVVFFGETLAARL